ncbi:sodium/potassium/calcium exchanger 4-like [Teleopsis dalmanni]|uniref:sodium/potassium/calcium exchanger 4-like n=1 Tax=Teleopsis dalmanni TaxID=139649 RepID=UPI0018CF391B|nr:sodium/potassium/calcium exchanger 4-like [Teleopsis dalmanni]
MEKDVIGATFMAAAISGPALFLNCVGTFITGGDIGVSTIVGSAVFNMLAVPACCGLFVVRCIKLDWWSLTRDCLIYFLATLGLVITLYDGKVYWYEALSLVIAYFLYMTVMYYNDKVARTARQLISKYRQRKSRIRPFREVNEITPLLVSRNNNSSSKFGIEQISTYQALDIEKSQIAVSSTSVSSNDSDFADSPWQCSEQMNAIEFIFRWPITFILWLTIPDSRKNSKKKFFTFLMSIIWIGVLSYVVTFVITVIGDTLEIPDSIMGLTILAAGMSVPEALSSIIVSKHGQGAMGISNSIGSNTFDILLSLGLPWFIKAYFMPTNPDERWITLNSSGLSYSAICLLITLVCLYVAFVVNKFELNRKIGVACAIMYFIFLMFASMIELNVFFPVNLPVCSH